MRESKSIGSRPRHFLLKGIRSFLCEFPEWRRRGQVADSIKWASTRQKRTWNVSRATNSSRRFLLSTRGTSRPWRAEVLLAGFAITATDELSQSASKRHRNPSTPSPLLTPGTSESESISRASLRVFSGSL